MKRHLLSLLVICLATGIAINANADSMRFVVVAEDDASLPANFDALVTDSGGEVVAALPQIGAAIVKSSATSFPLALQSDDSIRAVLPDRLLDLPDDPIIPVAANPPTSGDDDFFFDLQWGHDAVNAPEAWEAGVRGGGVLVAVLDTGSDCEHADLAPNCRLDLEACFLDVTLQPWCHWLGSHTAGTIAAADNAYGTIGVAPEAEFFGVQVCGFSGCPASAIIPGIVYAADMDADLINMSLGGLDLISGAKVVKDCKAAGLPMDYCTSLQPSYIHNEILVFKRAFQYANTMNTTVIVSAGNSAVDADHHLVPELNDEGEWELVHYPSLRLSFADYPGTIGVSATAPINWCNYPNADFNNLTPYSNFGRSAIDFSAPGGNGWYFDGDEDPCEVAGVVRPAYVFDYVLSTNNIFSWYWATGTSMAAPHVTGVAALIISENGGDMAPSQVLTELKKRSEDAGKKGKDPAHGFGAARSGY